jgi:lysozyme
MDLDGSGFAFLKGNEGCRLEAYQDSGGVYTIGYGCTENVCPGMTITQGEADAMLKAAVLPVCRAINKLVRIVLEQNQFNALVSFTYNVGIGAFENSTLLQKLNNGDFRGAQKEFLRWNKVAGEINAGLVDRRARESLLFLSV